MKDPRIVFGVNCVWWDSIDKASKISPDIQQILYYNVPLPCCPHCKSMLMEVPSIEIWNKSVDEYEALDHPGYRKFVEWLRGKCFKTSDDAKAAYEAEVGGQINVY